MGWRKLLTLFLQAFVAAAEAWREYQGKRKQERLDDAHKAIDSDPDSYAAGHDLLKPDNSDDPGTTDQRQ